MPLMPVPAENVGTDNVRERKFEGVCRSKEVFSEKTLIYSREKKAEFYRVINEFPYVNNQVKKI